jgi:hypothetical protein
MSGFFNRLQRASRFYDTSAPAYLRTHPLTTDRIADMEARSESAPYQQVADSLDFQLVRARLRAQEDSPQDAVVAARNALKEKRYSSETAARYGLAALLRARVQETESVQNCCQQNDQPDDSATGGPCRTGRGNPTCQRRYQAGSSTYRLPAYNTAISAPCWRQTQQGPSLVDKLCQPSLDRRLWRLAAESHARLGTACSASRTGPRRGPNGSLIAAIERSSASRPAMVAATRRQGSSHNETVTKPGLAPLVGICPFWTKILVRPCTKKTNSHASSHHWMAFTARQFQAASAFITMSGVGG